MSKKKTIFAWVIVCLSAIVIIPLLSISVAFAEGEDPTGDPTGGGAAGTGSGGGTAVAGASCEEQAENWQTSWLNGGHSLGTTYKSQYDNCGAGFKNYSVSGSGDWPGGEATAEINNNTVPKCQQVGATEFYFLALQRVWVNRDAAIKVTGYVNNEFWHFRNVKQLTGVEGGRGRIPYVTGYGALNITDVRSVFDTAQSFGNNWVSEHPEDDSKWREFLDTPWEEVNWFCWNPDWGTPPPPPPPPPSDSSTMRGWFYSTSTIKLPVGAIATGIKEVKADDGETKTVAFSVDSDTINVTFEHTLAFNKGDIVMSTDGKLVKTQGADGSGHDASDLLSGVDTNWNVKTAYTDNGTFAAWPANDKASGVVSKKIDFQITGLTPGNSVKKCSKITYDQKDVYITEEKHITTAHADRKCKNPITGLSVSCDTIGAVTDAAEVAEDAHNDYVPSYANTGFSEVCIEVSRPALPSGHTTSAIMFAGESQNLGWHFTAATAPTRLLDDGQAIIYQVDASVAEADRPVSGSSSTSAPCSHYHSLKGNVSSCIIIDDGQSGNYDEEKPIKIPNKVGDKICNAFGYHYIYRYAIWTGSSTPIYIPDGRGYWYVFDSTCRTIAKKPTMAVWNSSILTEGSVWTSIARRFNSINFGELTNEGTTETDTFGSWTEFLGVIGGTIRNGATEFASGSVLYTGFKNSGTDSYKNFYPLTISNEDVDNPGNSNIAANSTLRTRLETYLKNKAGTIGGVQVYVISGNLDITSNIDTTGSYSSIYEIPQTIYFVSGDVNISSNVTQIDAWIVADGTINTCTEFASGTTQADPSGKSIVPDCTNQLIFNGPVFASDIKLNRSFGSDPDGATGQGVAPTNGSSDSSREAPAEIFNLRSDVYLWAYAQSSRYDSSYTETYSRELAPRY